MIQFWGRCGGGDLGDVPPLEGVAEDHEMGWSEGEAFPSFINDFIILTNVCQGGGN